VEGIEQKDFFTFYGELLFALSKPVDVIDLSTKSRFVEIIQRTAALPRPLIHDVWLTKYHET